MTIMTFCMLALLSTQAAPSASDPVHFQAHRGGVLEMPENTLAAYRYTWDLGGIPEVDICSTADHVIICLHDDTLKRTTNADTNADVPVSRLTFEEIRRWDAGVRFNAQYAGEKVPALEEVFQEMAARPTAEVYLDLKNVDLDQLGAMITKYDVAKRIIFCHNKVESCRKMRAIVPGLRTMLWIGGKVDEIQAKFRAAAADKFEGLDQVQIHLHPDTASPDAVRYLMPDTFVQEALKLTQEQKRDLEVLLIKFDAGSVSHLLDLGIRWFATDEPKRFMDCVGQAKPASS